MPEVRQRLIGLLDYVEQVVRLDERVAFRLSEYRLPDGSTFAVSKSDTQNLPGVRHDHRDDEGIVWLEVERLARKEPPKPPDVIAEWIVLSADPAHSPEVRDERLVTVTAAERDAAIAKGEVRPDDVLDAPRKRDEPDTAPPRFDLKLRLEDRPAVAEAIKLWIAGLWTTWSAAELPRRRTIALYQVLYKIFQLMEVADAGGVSPAARRLGLSKSIVSRRIVRLEEALGVQLLSRTTHGVALTEAGATFREHATRIVAELRAAQEAISPVGDLRGLLRVAAPLSFGPIQLAPVFAELARRYPMLHVHAAYSDRFVDLVAEGFDAAVRMGFLLIGVGSRRRSAR